MDEHTIDFLNPLTIMLFIAAWVSDVAFLGILGLAIPGVGFAIAGFIFMLHYGCGLVIVAVFWGKTRGWLAKLILLLAWIIPLPTLSSGLMFAIIASNKIAALLIETIVIQTVAIATAGAGEALEVGAAAAEGVDIAATAAEGAEAVAGGAEAAEGTEAAAGAETAAEGAEATKGTSDVMADINEGNPMENLQNELEEPESEPEQGESDKDPAKRRVKKVFDIADRFNKSDENEEEDESEDEAA